VTDPLSTSRTARESLARGLNALQADPSVPTHLIELAAPIAQAMGALHQIERTNQLAPHAEVALGHVRGALAQLQAQPPTHPAVQEALEAVANSLSLVHTLSRMANGPAPQPVAAPAPAPAAPPPVPVAQPQANTAAMPERQPVPEQIVIRPVAAAPPQVPSFPQPAPAPAARPQQPPPGFHAAPSPQAQRDPFAAAATAVAPLPVPAPAHAAPAHAVPAHAPPAPSGQVIAADLGAHSPTNFYKGLAGNDIIDHGGLFVSTYVPPKIGTQVRLRVSLPGGYEFEANAIVKWTREQGGDAPPGFGAQFTGITAEARQLVQRYVRNREPLFHDDM
jgi:uncharacterized protein (TIGR02266 family)